MRHALVSMLRGLVLFGENGAYVMLVTAIASARHPRSALAIELFIPSKVGVVFADPPYAKTDGTVFIHRL